MSVMIAPARDAKRSRPSKPTRLLTSAKQVFVDPLDDDEPSGAVIVTTSRAISRVALVATETGSRFQREGVSHDPMTWMMAPRTLFGGSTALEACLDRDACLRGILLHGLSIGLDADPATIDALARDDVDEDGEFDRDEFASRDRQDRRDHPACGRHAERHEGVRHTPPPGDDRREEPRLFTATVVAFDGVEIVQAFHASLATEEAEIAGRLYMRMGAAMADAVIVEGFDPGAPLVAALVAPALCHTLALVAADPYSPLAAGLDLNVEQRFLG